MSTKTGTLFMYCMIMMVGGCLPKSFKSSTGAKDKPVNAGATDANHGADTNSENATSPQPVTGIYLVACAIDKYPSVEEKTVRLPCRLNDSATKNKVEVGVPIDQWKFAAPEGSLIKVKQAPMPSDSIWHVLFEISGNDVDTLLQIVQSSLVRATVYPANQAKLVETAIPVSLKAAPQDVSNYQITNSKYTHILTEAMSVTPSPPGKTEYVCIGEHGGNLNPGRFIVGDEGCYITFGNERLIAPSYHFLAYKASYNWQQTTIASLPNNAIVVGKESDASPIYTCLATVDERGKYLGKTGPSYGGCDIAMAEGIKRIEQFDILVGNQ